jgi:hypothetical protein
MEGSAKHINVPIIGTPEQMHKKVICLQRSRQFTVKTLQLFSKIRRDDVARADDCFLYLKLLEELAPVLRAIAAAFRTSTAVHGGQLVVQDKPSQ